MEQLENTLNEWFGQKAPQLPMGLKNFLVMIAPYLAILGVILGVFGLIASVLLGGLALILSAGLALFSMAGQIIGLVASVISTIFLAMAISGLFSRTMSGWRNTYYSTLVSIAGGLISSILAFDVGGLFGLLVLLVFSAIGFYILFQLRPLYMGGASVPMSTPPTPPNPTPTV